MFTRRFAWAALIVAAQFLALPSWANPAGPECDTRAYNLAHGRVVFSDKCLSCHESGRKGDTEDWIERLEQPLDTMITHAINGHGKMPARGDQDLSDQEVAAAVAYVVHRAREIAVTEIDTLPPPAGGAAMRDGAPSDRATLNMFLLLLNQLNVE